MTPGIDETSSDALKVFISYSRVDQGFVDRLDQALESKGIQAFVDRSDIEKFVDWRSRIEQLVGASDTMIFVLSPESIASVSCAREIEIGLSLNKRFAPIVARDIGNAPVPDPLGTINYIFFSGQEFSSALEELVVALNTDVEWIREHTRLGEIGRRWAREGKPTHLLLQGIEADRARGWMMRRPTHAPEPTPLHAEFIDASHTRREQIRRSEWERVSALTQKIDLLIESGDHTRAVEALDQAIDFCAHVGEDDLAARGREFALRRSRIGRIVEFHRAAREAYVRAGEERFEDARSACKAALETVGVLDRKEWWQDLPVDELTAVDVDKVKREVHRQLLLMSAFDLQPGLVGISPKSKPRFDVGKLFAALPSALLRAFAAAGGTAMLPALRKLDNPEAAKCFSASLATLDRVDAFETAYALEGHKFPKSRTSSVMRRITSLLLELSSGPAGEVIPYKRLLAQDLATPDLERFEDLNPADYYFLGLFNFFVGKRKDSLLAKILVLFQGAFPEIDASSPFETAERMLRAGVSMEADNFWPHFVLGRTLQGKGDCQGAELAFNVCISIDSTYSRGYEQRAVSLAQQWRRKPFENIRIRALDDSRRALELAGHDPSTFWPRGEVLEMLGRTAESIEAYSRWLELEHRILDHLSRSAGVKQAHDFAQKLARQSRVRAQQGLYADCLALMGQAQWIWSHRSDALALADQALGLKPEQARAHTLRGMAMRDAGERERAVECFETAIRFDPFSYLAMLQRAETLEEVELQSKAVDAWRELATRRDRRPPPPDWMLAKAGEAQRRQEAVGALRDPNPSQVV